ncbi:YbaY family lipoprotein [Pelagibacterium sp.]|uniref:YbaY family lipoprotein n=1 Tax=Pelagibacterium sp. TaxID=1967288 RepID=UPI003A8D1A23
MTSISKPVALAALTTILMTASAFGDGLTITGDIAYRERIALPENAVATVALVDVSLADAPAVTIGQDIIDPAGQVPIGFVVDFDSDAIVKGNSYAISARIEVDGELWFINDTRISVDPLAQTEVVSVPLVSARSSQPSADDELDEAPVDFDLLGTSWVLTMLGDQPASTDFETTLHFSDTEASLGGVGGCNSYGGTIASQGEGSLIISNVFSTMMACDDAKMSQERAYFDALSIVSGYGIEDGVLTLVDQDGKVLVALTAHTSE